MNLIIKIKLTESKMSETSLNYGSVKIEIIIKGR